MKQLTLILSLVLMVGLTGGCGKNGTKQAEIKPQAGTKIAVLTLDGDLAGQTADQARELDMVMQWMDRDIIKIMRQAGFEPVLIKEMQGYKSDMGKLLVIEVERFNAGNRAARAFVGFGAGAASLDLGYKLLDENGALLSEWRDGVGSSKGGTYCAQTLDRRALGKVSGLLNK